MARTTTLASITLLMVAGIAGASTSDRLYDFTDDYYRANGINPAKLGGRIQIGANAVADTPFFSWQRPVRVIRTSAGYGSNGSAQFFATIAGFGLDGFTDDAAGRNAKTIAEKYVEYVFPSQGDNPVGLGNPRQSVILDTNHGYFSNNPLGLWLHVWVSYTPSAFSTSDGRKMLEDLMKRNGPARDGTPIIKTLSEIKNLKDKGYIAFSYRTDGLRYAVCPIIKDPRNGGIAPDAFYNPIRRADGTLVEPYFFNWFNSLKTTGDWED